MHLVVWNIFLFNMFSTCLRLSTLTSKFLLLIFLMFLGVSLVEITFSIRKGENLASSKDSMTMNLGKSAASPSKSDSDRFHLDLFIGRRHSCCIFFTGLELHYPPWSQTCVVNEPRGNLFTFVETEIHNQYTQAENRFSSHCQF